MTATSWQCPFCNHFASQLETFPINWVMDSDSAIGKLQFRGCFFLCPNPDCKQVTIVVEVHTVIWSGREWVSSDGYSKYWTLRPDSSAKVFPEYVPKAVLDDYQEACLIKDLSPKASATLARRALQGMIRDFWKVSKPNLKQEIEAIREKVDPDTWKAIDGVREIGNIGAHMESDINVIIDVEPKEADSLIWLIESLIRDWYMARADRQARLAELAESAAKKKTGKTKSGESP